LVLAPAATAGHYQVSLIGGQGVATYTPYGGAPQTTPLAGPAWSQNAVSGTFSYWYDRTYAYQWIEGCPGEPPQDEIFAVIGESTLDFSPTMYSQFQSGTANAWVEIGTWRIEAEATAGPGGFTEPPNGQHWLYPGYWLTGPSGQFTVQFRGGAQGSLPVIAHWHMHNPNTGNKFIKIATAELAWSILNPGDGTVTVTGDWSQPTGGSSNPNDYRITLVVKQNPGQRTASSAVLGPPLNGNGKWNKAWVDRIGSGYNHFALATLQVSNSMGGWDLPGTAHQCTDQKTLVQRP